MVFCRLCSVRGQMGQGRGVRCALALCINSLISVDCTVASISHRLCRIGLQCSGVLVELFRSWGTAQMKLLRYRVTNFRSVADSGWIDCNDVTAFIGVNESGKTNLLLPLWKLKPAKEGELIPTADYPIKLFTNIRTAPAEYKFIEAEFESSDVAEPLSRGTLFSEEEMSVVRISRWYDGHYTYEFPNATPITTAASQPAVEVIDALRQVLPNLKEMAKERGCKNGITDAASKAISGLPREMEKAHLEEAISTLRSVLDTDHAKGSAIYPPLELAISSLESLLKPFNRTPRAAGKETQEWILNRVPVFIYYSNYGNLDSEIYLPQVVQNLARTDLGAREAAKARTLRILFKFVGLEPTEILELGQEFHDKNNPNRQPTAEEIEAINERKKERSILLQSAGTNLTTKFREWWKQGDHRFRFDADGDHFRIWVSDERRPEEVELEGRSTGLQWFLSFFLVFLVEAEEEHKNAVLLLDEPGLSLHPLAQRDLSEFFESLSDQNQLLYTTHSPFLVDADHLDRSRKVYVDEDGTTKATSDLQAGESAKSQPGATYAVYSALGLSVAESLLLGCQPVVVEGPSDQILFSAIKIALISGGNIKPPQELVFPPSGGAKSVKVISSLLLGRDQELPYVVLDDDDIGRSAEKELRRELYKDQQAKVINVGNIVGFEGAESEDLIPADMLVPAVDRAFRCETLFETVYKPNEPVVPQIEAWASSQGVILEKGWKVGLAKSVKQRIMPKKLAQIDEVSVKRWQALFDAFLK